MDAKQKSHQSVLNVTIGEIGSCNFEVRCWLRFRKRGRGEFFVGSKVVGEWIGIVYYL